MGLSRTVSQINGDFSRKSQNVPTPVYFAPPTEGVHRSAIGASAQKTRMMRLPGWERNLPISSAVWMYQRDRRTDRQADTGRQQRPRSTTMGVAS